MKSKLLLIITFTVSASFLSQNSFAADDARLKENLRVLTLRLRSAETERNNLLSEKAQFEQEKKTLTDKVNALTKQAAADKETIANLTSKTTDRETELAQAKEALAKWKSGYELAAAAAQKTEAERVKLANESIILKRKLADRESKNLALFKLGNEILTRYEQFGLGESLAAREPFTGIARVKLENLVQGYQDKLADELVKQ